LIETPKWLGDFLMASPSIENLRLSFPDANFYFLASGSAAELLAKNNFACNVFAIEKGFKGFLSQTREMPYFNYVVSFRNTLRSNFYLLFIRAKKKFIYKKEKYKSLHQVQKYNEFINQSFSLKTSPGPILINQIIDKRHFLNKTIGINPGSTYGSAKRWRVEGFIQVAIKLSSEFNIVIIGGKNEVDVAKKIELGLKNAQINNFKNLCGKTTLSELIGAIDGMSVLITGDSGPMHIAAALKIPTVSIFGPTNHLETCQWGNIQSVIIKKEMNCQPCMKRVCPLCHHDCMEKISSKEVIESALNLI